MMTADIHDVNVQVVQNTLDLLAEFDPEMTYENMWLCGACRGFGQESGDQLVLVMCHVHQVCICSCDHVHCSELTW